MQRLFFAFVFCGFIVSLSLDTRAKSPVAGQKIKAATSAYAELDFEKALSLIQQAKQEKGNSRDQLLHIYHIAGAKDTLSWYALAEGEHFSQLRQFGDIRHPARLEIIDRAEQEVATSRPWYKRWWVWTIVGGLAHSPQADDCGPISRSSSPPLIICSCVNLVSVRGCPLRLADWIYLLVSLPPVARMTNSLPG